jgi:hypothetical protein
MQTIDPLSTTFAALADPTRRAILSRLAEGEATVNELSAPFDVSLQAVSRHLKVLERAGLITRRRDAQFRPCRFEAEPLGPAPSSGSSGTGRSGGNGSTSSRRTWWTSSARPRPDGEGGERSAASRQPIRDRPGPSTTHKEHRHDRHHPNLGELTYVRTWDAPRELVFACMTTPSTSPTSGARRA